MLQFAKCSLSFAKMINLSLKRVPEELANLKNYPLVN